MASEGDRYAHPLIDRYASAEMAAVFSPRAKHTAWRDLWIALAQAQQELGLAVTPAQISALREQRDHFDWDRVAALERELRHDVMAHVHHFGELAPTARGIIHWGATSCYVTDNSELLLYRRGLLRVAERLRRAAAALAAFASEHRALPCLGYTHYQVAQPVTVGKRACLWLQDLLIDLDEVERLIAWLPFRGLKGVTGTQATFLSLVEGDHAKVVALEKRVAEQMGFDRLVPVSGQTYTRKIDWSIHSALAGIAQSAAKLGNDVRLLSHDGELGEPRGTKQVGSSAMPYKRNPMRCERICSLARYVISTADTSAQTAATQWLERTLDDSAVRRIALPESFLAIDAILILVENVAAGLTVYPGVIRRRLEESLPFVAAEEILMAGVRAGGDRQELHERMRVHSGAAAQAVADGQPNPLLQLIADDPGFAAIRDHISTLTEPGRFVGRAAEQVDAFLRDEARPRLGSVDRDQPAEEPRV
ncbi:MAG: adenylosuccinate lyase [Planctomycetota bacterium]